MGKSEGRKRLIFFGKTCQLRDHIHQFLFYQFQSLRHNNNIRIVTNITGCRSEVDDTGRLRALLPIGIYMAHHVVTHFLLSCLCHIIIDIFRVGFQFINLLLCDNRLSVLTQAQFHFRFRKCDPQLSPCPKFHIG